jgi:hypothetical protein
MWGQNPPLSSFNKEDEPYDHNKRLFVKEAYIVPLEKGEAEEDFKCLKH